MSASPKDDGLTAGAESLAKATAAGFTPDRRSPAGKAQRGSLLEAYTRYRQRQEAALKADADEGGGG
jgi:hypothetical protein